MRESETNPLYMEWLFSMIDPERCCYYSKLLYELFRVDFEWFMPMDSDRARDGVGLRTIFERDCLQRVNFVGDKCSVLEMLVALARRCDTDVMHRFDEGDGTFFWFWLMINNLGLLEFDDDHYDEEQVDLIIYNLLHREYRADGKGSLFPTRRSNVNMANVDIWYQMNWYLIDNFMEGKIWETMQD